MAAGFDKYGNPTDPFAWLNLSNPSRQGADLFNLGSLLDVQVKKPTKKELEEAAEQMRKQQLQAEAQYIASSLLSSPVYQQASTFRKKKMLEDWEKNRWKPWADQRFGDDIESREDVRGTVMEALRAPLKERQQEIKEGSGRLLQAAHRLGQGFSNAALAIGYDSFASLAAADADSARRRLEDLENRIIPELKTVAATGRDMTAMLDPEVRRLGAVDDTSYNLALAQTTAERLRRELPALDERARMERDRATGKRQDVAALDAQIEQSRFPQLLDEELRKQELAEMGSRYPTFAFAAENPANALGRAPGFVAEQVGNVASIALPAAGGGLVAGPPGAIAGAALGGAPLMAGYLSEDASQAVLNLTPQQLAASPEYQRLLVAGYTPDQAVEAMRQAASAYAGGVGLLEGVAFSGISPEYALARGFQSTIPQAINRAIPGAVGRFGAHAGAGALVEGGQEFGEALAPTIAMNRATGLQSDLPWSQAVEAAGLGALIGGGLGGLGTLGSRTQQAPRQVDIASQPAAATPMSTQQAVAWVIQQRGISPAQAQTIAAQVVASGQPVTPNMIAAYIRQAMQGQQQAFAFASPGGQMTMPWGAPTSVEAPVDVSPAPGQLDLFNPAPQMVDPLRGTQRQLPFMNAGPSDPILALRQRRDQLIARNDPASTALALQIDQLIARQESALAAPVTRPETLPEVFPELVPEAGTFGSPQQEFFWGTPTPLPEVPAFLVPEGPTPGQMDFTFPEQPPLEAPTPAMSERTPAGPEIAARLREQVQAEEVAAQQMRIRLAAQRRQGDTLPTGAQRTLPFVAPEERGLLSQPVSEDANAAPIETPVPGQRALEFDQRRPLVERLQERLENAGRPREFAAAEAPILNRMIETLADVWTHTPDEVAQRLQLTGPVPLEDGSRGAYSRSWPKRMAKIFFGDAADGSTGVHEFTHFLIDEALDAVRTSTGRPEARARLEQDLRQLAGLAGLTDVQALDPIAWYASRRKRKSAHEIIATQMERYLHTGVAPQGLESIFSRIAQVMRTVYQSIRQLGGGFPKKLQAQFDEIFGRMLTGYTGGADALGGSDAGTAGGLAGPSVTTDSGMETAAGVPDTGTLAASFGETLGTGAAAESPGTSGVALPGSGTLESDGSLGQPVDTGTVDGGADAGSSSPGVTGTTAIPDASERGNAGTPGRRDDNLEFSEETSDAPEGAELIPEEMAEADTQADEAPLTAEELARVEEAAAQLTALLDTMPTGEMTPVSALIEAVDMESADFVDAQTSQIRDEDLGTRSMGSLGKAAADGIIETLNDANPAAEQTTPLVRRALDEFQRTFTPRTDAERSYAGREFNQAVADAVVDAARSDKLDPFYRSVEGSPVGNGLAAVSRNAQTIGILVSETDLLPGTALPEAATLPENARAIDGLPADLGYTAAWLREHGVVKDGHTVVLVDRATGRAYAVKPGAQRWEVTPIGFVSGRHIASDRAMTGVQSIQQTLELPSGEVRVIDSLRGEEGQSIFTNRKSPKEPGFAHPGTALRTFTGDIFYVGDSLQAADYSELMFQAARVPDGATPANLNDVLSSHPQGTPTRAKAGDVDAQAMLDAINDPKFADVAYNAGGNPVTDQMGVDALLQHSVDATNNRQKPTTGELKADGVEGPLSYAGRTILVTNQGENVGGNLADLANSINSILAGGGGVAPPVGVGGAATPAAPSIPGGSAPTTRGLAQQIRTGLRTGFFSSGVQFGPSQAVRRSRTLGTWLAHTTKTVQATWRQWLGEVEPVLGTEQENHPAYKAQVLTASQTAAAAQRLQQEILEPIGKKLHRIGRKVGKTATQVRNEIDQWATCRHTIEAEPFFRQQALVDKRDAAIRANNVRLQRRLQAQLDAYDAFQKLPADQAAKTPHSKRPRIAGGRSIAEAQAVMQSIEQMYDMADILEIANDTTAGFEATTAELERVGLITPEDRQRWNPYKDYVALTTSTVSNLADANDVAPFLKVGRFDYTRHGSQTAAEGSLSALEKKISRTASALGSREFAGQLNELMNRLIAANNGDTRGLMRLPMAAIQKGMQSENSNRAQFYRKVNETPGVIFTEKRRTNAGEMRNISWKILYDPRGDPSLPLDSDENLALRQHHAELSRSLVGALEVAKAIQKPLDVATTGTRIMGQLLVKFRPAIAPVLGAKDLIGRTLNMAGREVLGPTGKPIGGWTVASRMLALSIHPNMFADFTSWFFKRPGHEQTYFGKYLSEGQEAGAFHTLMDTLRLDKREGAFARGRSLVGAPWRWMNKVLSGIQEYCGMYTPALHYAAMRELGVLPGDAAAKTLELMNFHERGAATPYLQAIYPFFRATIQDGAAMLRSLGIGHNAWSRSPTRGKVRAWTTLFGLTFAMNALIPFLRGMAGDDEDTGVNKYDAIPMTQLMWGIPLFDGSGGKVKFPTGFGPGQVAWVSANVFDRVNRGLMEPVDGTLAIAGAFYRGVAPNDIPPYEFSKNPAGWLLQTFTPTIGRPLIEEAMNTDAFGRPIHTPSGNIPVGTRKFESGRHLTPDFWHRTAKGIFDTFGVDIFPETLRHTWTEYMQGPLSLMTSYWEADSRYKRPNQVTLADKVGLVPTALGASAYYSAPNAVQTEMYYRYKGELESKITRAGAKTTSPDTKPGEKIPLVRRNMAAAGFDAKEIESYVAIVEADKELDKLDTAFRKEVKPYRFDEDAEEKLRARYERWQNTREAIMARAVRKVEGLR